MNIQEQNVPQSYRDLLATIPEKSNFFYEYARRKKPTLPKRVYVIQGFFSLTRETDDRSEELIPTYRLLAQKDFFYKSIEGNSIDKLPSVEVLKTAFAFGFSDGGILFFHPENHSVWVIYDDLYTELVANTFDEFLEKATFQKQWDLK